MRKKLTWYLVGVAAAMITADSMAAPYLTQFPTMWWSFDDNTQDGAIPSGAFATAPLPLMVSQRNDKSALNNGLAEAKSFFGTAVGNLNLNASKLSGRDWQCCGSNLSGNTYGNSPTGNTNGGFTAATLVNGAATAAPEHYVAGPKPYSGTGYHANGAQYTVYNNIPGTPGGDNIINPLTDSTTTDGGYTTRVSGNNWRDMLNIATFEGVGGATGTTANTVIGSSPSFNNRVVTYAGWFKIIDGTNQGPVETQAYTSNTAYLFGRSGSNSGVVSIKENTPATGGTGAEKYSLFVRADGAGTTEFGTAYQFAPSDGWQHFVVEYDLSNGTTNQNNPLNYAKIYINGGTLAGGSEETFFNLGARDPGNILKIGSDDGRSQRMNNYWDDIGIWIGKKLTPADVFNIYTNGIAAAVPEPSGLGLAAMGLMSLFAVRRKRRV